MSEETRKQINVLKDIVRQPFAFPGGYEKVAIADDDGIICSICCKTEFRNILHSTKFGYYDGWHVMDVFLSENVGEPLYCSHCGRDINCEED